jgi:hypothetical protein
MTRKVRNSKRRKKRTIRTRLTRITKRTRVTKRTRNIKGGAGIVAKIGMAEMAKMASGASAKTLNAEGEKKPNERMQSFIKLLNFSLSSLIISPLYIMAVIANIPLNTINNLSGRSFNGHRTDALGIQLYKYMFEGYKKDKIGIGQRVEEAKDKFIIDDGLSVKDDIITKCDSEKCNAKKGGYKMKDYKMKGGYVDTYKTIKELMGVMSKDEQVIHNLKSLEDTIDSIKLDFDGRKSEIVKMFANLKDPKILLKFIVVINNLIGVCKESYNPAEKVRLVEDNVIVQNPYQIVNENLNSPMDVLSAHLNLKVCYLNPDCMKSCNKCDMLTNIACVIGTKTGLECEKCSCNLFSNIISIYNSYLRILLKSFGGNSNNLYFIIDILFMIIRYYANKENYKMDLNLDNLRIENISRIGYKGDFREVKGEQFQVIELFKKIICKYGIYEIVKKNFMEALNKATASGQIKNFKKELLSICD